MAIILDHTSSGNITLKGSPNALPQDNFTFTFPNVTGVSYILSSGASIDSISVLPISNLPLTFTIGPRFFVSG